LMQSWTFLIRQKLRFFHYYQVLPSDHTRFCLLHMSIRLQILEDFRQRRTVHFQQGWWLFSDWNQCSHNALLLD
jgi:hypothetical protein